MQVDAGALSSLDSEFPGYLEHEDVDRFFARFGIRFSAGHWCAGGFSDRFCRTYLEEPIDESPVGQLTRVAEAGIAGVELNNEMFLDAALQPSDALIREVTHALDRLGLVATNMNTNIWTRARYKMGSITNPDAARRREAIDYCLQTVELAHRLGCPSVQLWPGSDGWDYHFEVNYGRQLDWFIDGCVQIARKAASLGLRFGTEAKQKEPREGNMILNTTAKAALVAKTVNEQLGSTVMGVVIDYGHEQMVGNQPADSLYLLRRVGVPIANFHINAAKYNSNDEDRVTGTDDIWRLAEFCYAAIDTGYDGWFGEDQFTYRMDPVRAMRLSRELFANAMKKALRIYAQNDRLRQAQDSGESADVIDVVKRVLM
ncbi:MAG: sugar phosphate isomerase/epimerase [Armatimonadetes bacterium]|nr:sugar phosphate isomerase/epimerase [Armatimonadota bacterium]MDE2206507.1 sugar phosphate isomerase/epimerase [Armatimonadota bacterium]